MNDSDRAEVCEDASGVMVVLMKVVDPDACPLIYINILLGLLSLPTSLNPTKPYIGIKPTP